MRIKTVTIDADVEDVLRAAKLEGNNLYLQGQLSRPLYEKVNKVLSLIGFKWTSGKVKAHVGQGDSMTKLQEALGSGKVVDEKQTFQFFETPAQLAARLVSLADIKPEHAVLEPSAGKGAIVRAIQLSCPKLPVVHAFELNLNMINASPVLLQENVAVTCLDFLDAKDLQFDRIVMNPPFTGGQDVDHVRHAYKLLRPGGRLVAIMSKSWLFNSTRKFLAFRAWYEGHQEVGLASTPEEVPAGTFKQSGTEISTIIVIILKPSMQ